jgi:hypothetical protein
MTEVFYASTDYGGSRQYLHPDDGNPLIGDVYRDQSEIGWEGLLKYATSYIGDFFKIFPFDVEQTVFGERKIVIGKLIIEKGHRICPIRYDFYIRTSNNVLVYALEMWLKGKPIIHTFINREIHDRIYQDACHEGL